MYVFVCVCVKLYIHLNTLATMFSIRGLGMGTVRGKGLAGFVLRANKKGSGFFGRECSKKCGLFLLSSLHWVPVAFGCTYGVSIGWGSKYANNAYCGAEVWK